MNKPFLLMFSSLLCLITNVVNADVLPPGHKNIQHQIVFESSPLFADYRLLAAPIRGFGGVHVVVPGEPLQFSSKYGTQFYLVPKSETVDLKFDRDSFKRWPSVHPPVSQVSSVPAANPVATITTTVRFSEVNDGKPVIILVDHKELDSIGLEASYWRAYWWLVIPVIGGVALLAFAYRGIQTRSKLSSIQEN